MSDIYAEPVASWQRPEAPQYFKLNHNGSRILAGSFYVTMLLPYFHFFLLVNRTDRYEPAIGTIGTILSLVSVILIFISAFLYLLFCGPIPKLTPTGPSLFIFLLFSVSFVFSPLSIAPLFSALYSLAAIVLLLFLQLVNLALTQRGLKDLQRCGWLILILMAVLILYHDTEFPRKIGGIQPNHWSKMSILAMAVAFMSERGKKYIFVLAALILTSFAASRGGFILILIFLITYAYFSQPLGKFFGILISTLVFGLLISILAFSIWPDLYQLFYEDILAINDKDRAIIGSGFTGRLDYWRLGLYIFSEGSITNLIFGNGFATRTGTTPEDLRSISAHQGYINTLLDVGLVGLGLFIAAVLWSIFKGVKNRTNSKRRKYHAAATAYICAYLVAMLIDPLYLRIGTPFSFLFFFSLVATSQDQNSYRERKAK